MVAPSPTTESPSDFCSALARIAVSQICQSVGFKFTQQSALETLTLVATKYLQAIAKSSAAFAAAANRSDVNLFDLSNALRDLRTTNGISGSTNFHRTDFCLIKSGDLAQIANFVDYAVENPFAKPIPRPLDPVKKADENVRRNPAVPRAAHIPNWLPEVPETRGECGVVLRSGEELWEICLERSGTGTEEICGVGENGSFERGNLELGEMRERVRFKIGVNLKSGVCKRDQRVCWDGHKNRNAYRKDNLSVVGNEVNDNGKNDSLLS